MRWLLFGIPVLAAAIVWPWLPFTLFVCFGAAATIALIAQGVASL